MTTDRDIRKFIPSRRKFLHGAALVTGGAALSAASLAAGFAAAAAGKMSQQAAAYQPTAKGQQRCNNCTQWQAPAACKIVEGEIAASGWCNLYVAK